MFDPNAPMDPTQQGMMPAQPAMPQAGGLTADQQAQKLALAQALAKTTQGSMAGMAGGRAGNRYVPPGAGADASAAVGAFAPALAALMKRQVPQVAGAMPAQAMPVAAPDVQSTPIMPG